MHTPQYNRATVWLSACLALCLLPLSAISAELSGAEKAVAKGVIDTLPWASSTRSTDAAHPLGIQTLSIEADWKKHASGQRLARTYQFNHSKQTSRLLVVDLDRHSVVNVQAINSVHLPLNDTEIEYAKTLLSNDATFYTLLNREREQQSLGPVSGLTMYDVKASIYEPNIDAHACALQRCVLFALVDQSLTVSSIEPLVNLYTGSVVLLQDTLQ